MENRDRIIELLTAVRYTTNDIEKVADEICLLFDVVGQSEQLKAFAHFLKWKEEGYVAYHTEEEMMKDYLSQ